MRMLTGALLLLASEQAYAHANLVHFPNHIEARVILVPASLLLLGLGMVMLVWGVWSESRKGHCSSATPAGPSHSTKTE